MLWVHSWCPPAFVFCNGSDQICSFWRILGCVQRIYLYRGFNAFTLVEAMGCSKQFNLKILSVWTLRELIQSVPFVVFTNGALHCDMVLLTCMVADCPPRGESCSHETCWTVSWLFQSFTQTPPWILELFHLSSLGLLSFIGLVQLVGWVLPALLLEMVGF